MEPPVSIPPNAVTRCHAAGAARPADDELGGEDDHARALGPAALDALEQELRAERAERLRRLLHHGQERVQPRGVLDVVEADERDVVGNLEPGGRTASIAPSATRLLTVKTAVGRLRRARAAAACPRSRRVGSTVDVRDQRRIEPGSRRRQRGLVAPPTVARGRDVVGLDDEADAAVAERDQVLDELPRAARAVAEDGVGVDAGDGAVDQHERDAEPGEPPQVLLASGR